MNEIAFLTFCYGDEGYYKLAQNLINQFKDSNYDLFVYTDRDDYFENVEVIPYQENRNSYHHKIKGIDILRKKGYKKIVYIDSDILIYNEEFLKDLSHIEFRPGFNFSRNGTYDNILSFFYVYGQHHFKHHIESSYSVDLTKVISVWEDIILVDFTNYSEGTLNNFFNCYYDLMNAKHHSDNVSNYKRYGDNEGFSIRIASMLSGIGCEVNEEITNSLHHLRAINYTYDTYIKSIMSEVEFVFPYRKDSEEREQNLNKCLEYYGRYFKDSRFVISEQGTTQTLNQTEHDYIFTQKDLPHNQAMTINTGVNSCTKKIVCVVDSDIILLNYYNIYLATREMFIYGMEYCLPYFHCVDIPNFNYRSPWEGMCIGGIYLVDRQKFVDVGLNDESFEGWGREDDHRHIKLMNNGFKFKRFDGYIIHMDHPIQNDRKETAERNYKLLKDYIDVHGCPDKV